MTTHKAEQETFCTSHLVLLGFVFSLASKFRMSPKEHRSARPAFSLSRDQPVSNAFPLHSFPRGDGLGTAWWDTTLSGLTLLLSSVFLAVPQQAHCRQGEDSGESLSLQLP